MIKLFCILLIIINITLATSVDYTGYKVLKFKVENDSHVKLLSRFIHNKQFIVEDHPLTLGRSTTIGIPPTYISYINQQAEKIQLKYAVIYEDLQTIIDLEKSTVDRKTINNEFDFDVFNTYESIVEQLNYWNDNCPVGFECDLYSFGQSHEGRELYALKISQEGGKPYSYWFNGVTHSREWLGTATLLKIIDRFWTEYGVDPDITNLLDGYEWYFAPVTNPDGYIYTHEEDRMWRKNRGPNEGSECIGTDMNRNYDSSWGTDGISHDPCDYEVYCGSGPASTNEIAAIQAETSRLAAEKTLLAFVDVHAFGEMILMPFGYTVNGEGEVCAQAENHDNLYQVANAFADAIEATYNEEEWIRGPPCEILYPASGGSMDWAVESGGALYGFGPELRGPFFTVDPVNIEPSSREFFNGIVAMVDEIAIIEEL